jgi:putative phage-type endonuclease
MQSPRIYRDISQGSEEWHAMRCGVITASRFKDVLARGKGKTRRSYMVELAGEILTGIPHEGYRSKAMRSGTEREPEARKQYSLMSGYSVEEVAFVTREDVPGVGVSPDCLVVGEPGIVEIKCPQTNTQLKNWQEQRLPSEYLAQVQGQLWITGRDWCDWVSRDHRIDGVAGYVCVRVERDDDYIKEMAAKIADFRNELLELVRQARG